MYDKKAEMGIATLILIAAMILVSAVVFYVLTTSVNQVTQESRAVGMTVRENVGSAMNVVKLYAEDGSSGASVDYFYEEVKAPYGSDEIGLNDTVLIMELSNNTREYSYDATIDCDNKTAANANSTYNDSNAHNFGVQWVRGSATYADTIVSGELVRLCWKSPESVVKDEAVSTIFFGKQGYTARLHKIEYDDLITEKTIYFFP